MKKYFSVGEAAKAAQVTGETLRHYDRIGLVKPSKRDSWSKYRYYTSQDIVRLNTVKALRMMDLSLQQIKQVLEYDDLEKIVAFLNKAEKIADEKIDALMKSKEKIRIAKADYENKLKKRQIHNGMYIHIFPARVIMLSDTLRAPSLDNLWNYLEHFYDKINPSLRSRFSFEDLAGVYTENGISRLFAVCIRHAETEGLKTLPAGKYLCADCGGEDADSVMKTLINTASEMYMTEPKFMIRQVVVSGILHWDYQLQVPLFN